MTADGSTSERRRSPGRPFKPGQSGNPGGMAAGTAELRALARTHTVAAIEALAALLAQHGGTWQGTAAELLALLPGAAPDATRLGKLLGDAAALGAAGVTLQRRRVPKTGKRLLVLRAVPPVPLPAPPVPQIGTILAAAIARWRARES